MVVPCHNAGAFVRETLDSVLAQTHAAVEIIVIDDSSTDRSWDIIVDFAERYPAQVRAVRLEQNRGGGYARNRGAALAGGSFLMFLDADDLITPRALEALVGVVRDVPGALAAGECCMLERTPDGTWVNTGRNAPLPNPEPDAALRGWLEATAWVPPCALLWRRDTYETSGGWDDDLARNQDGDIAMRALAQGARVLHTPTTVGFYRIHGDQRVSVSRNFVAAGKLESQVRVLDRLSTILRAQQRVEAFAPSLAKGYYMVALLGFQNGHVAVARQCLLKGRRLSGRWLVSATRAGRLLEWALGLEHKERLVQALGRLGIMTRGRRTVATLRARATGELVR